MRLISLVALAVISIVSILTTGCFGDFSEESEPEGPPTNAKELFERCVSPWDGNHDGFEEMIRLQLNDPGSMETHSTKYRPADSIDDGTIGIWLDYSAANVFGGMVRQTAVAQMGLNCEIVTVIDYGF